MTPIHASVLLEETMEYLNIKKGGTYIDATLGGGGHARAMLKRLGKDSKVIGIERDVALAARIRSENVWGLSVEHGNYRDMEQIVQREQVGRIDGILFDFGMSSWHVDDSGRGFSFLKDEPLDMRYEPSEGGESAAAVINSYSTNDLARIFREYGEERNAHRIAKRIVEERRKKRITTSGQFASIVVTAVQRRGKIHPATRVFQALRICVNREFETIRAGLEAAYRLVAPHGRIVAISFHSLEDRIVKEMFRAFPGRIVTKKPVTPMQAEIAHNPRSRSARLRAWEKV